MHLSVHLHFAQVEDVDSVISKTKFVDNKDTNPILSSQGKPVQAVLVSQMFDTATIAAARLANVWLVVPVDGIFTVV